MTESFSADAVRLFQESLAAEKSGDDMLAYQLLLGALAEESEFPGAWNNLAVHLSRQRRWSPAAAAFSKALQLSPDAWQVKANYAWNLHLSGRSDEALPLIQEVVSIDGSRAQDHVNMSQILLALDQLEGAGVAARRATDIAPQDPQAKLALGLAQLRLGNYEDGLRNYENRMAYVPALQSMLKYPYPLWRGEDLTNKRLFVPCEQGLGDSVMFMRFLPEAIKRSKKTIIHAHDSCLSLFRHNLTLKCGSIGWEIHPIPKELPAADYFCPLISLPVAMKLTNDHIKDSFWTYKTLIPDIKPNKAFNIGICWAGDPKHDNDRYRSATLEDFLVLAEIPGVRLYSLQLGARRADLDTLGAHGLVRDLGGHLKDAIDTANICKHILSAVVSVDTAPAHIAGSAGCKTYTLIASNGVDWRWQTGEGKTPWYPTMELFRQKRGESWKNALKRLKSTLIVK